MKKIFTVLCWMLCATGLYAQQPGRQAILPTASVPAEKCGTMHALEQQIRQDKGYIQRREQIEQHIQSYLNNPALRASNAVVTIPVVFHVVGPQTQVQSIATATRLQAQINVLNQDYSKTNPDAGQVPSYWQSISSDMEFQFCIATVDPSGNPTTGIERRVTTTNTIWTTNDAIKFNTQGGMNAWNRDKYLNIWVGNLGNSLLGYAYFPGVTANIDGVVIGHTTLPGAPGGAPVNGGRTATHEIGHWMSLYHPFDNGCSTTSNCSTTGDRVCDTPPTNAPTYFCPSGIQASACAAAGTNGKMWMNYMDYVDDACMYMFTAGQKTRARAVFATGGARNILTTSTACTGVSALTANFTASPTTVAAGGTVSFTNTSTGGATTYSWSFPGGTPATSTAQNPTVVYNTPGTYAVTLIAGNGTTTDSEIKPGYITVTGSSGGSCIDTLSHIGPNDTLTIYTSAGATPGTWGGYVAGNNYYGDKAKAEKFTVSGATTMSKVLFLFSIAKKTSGNPNVNVTVNIHNIAASGEPGTIITSGTIPLTTLVANVNAQAYSSLTFPTPVAIPASGFFVSVVLPTTNGDSLALYTNRDNSTSVANLGWEQFSDNTWHAYSTPQPAGWGLNISNAIFPILGGNPNANFTAASTTTCVNAPVTFTSTSTGAVTYLWSFPGGTPASSTSPNPTVTYATTGTKNVTLTVTSACNTTDSEVKNGYITVSSSVTSAIIGLASSYCTNSQAATLTGSPGGGTFSGTGVSGSTFNPTAAGVGPHVITYTPGGSLRGPGFADCYCYNSAYG